MNDRKHIENMKIKGYQNDKLTNSEKWACLAVALFIISLIVAGVLPAYIPFETLWECR